MARGPSSALALDGPVELLVGFGIALAIGALIGVERERKKRVEVLGTGGLRTFVLIAEAGALSAWIAKELAAPWIFLGGGALVTAVVITGYVMEVRLRPESLGMTTEISAVVTYLLGGAVLLGHAELAVALAIATTATLAFKEPLHGLVERIGREDLEAGLKLLFATFVVLPVLPNRAVDPWGVLNPYEMWWLVILISFLSLVGYVATRVLGSARGSMVTGLAGGLVSSTAVTLGFARRSREREAGSPRSLAAGLLLSWAVMFARIGVMVAVVYRPLFLPLLVPLGTMGLLTLALALLDYRSGGRSQERAPEVQLTNPFRLSSSIRFALFFAAILLLVELVRRELPPGGMYAVAALAGLTDVDAITLSMAGLASGGGSAELAAGSIVTAALANTVVKCGIVAFLGSAGLRGRILRATGFVLGAGVLVLLVRAALSSGP